jgi:hypothetical protein
MNFKRKVVKTTFSSCELAFAFFFVELPLCLFYHLAYRVDFMINILLCLLFISFNKTFAGLNAGMLCAGILLLYF